MIIIIRAHCYRTLGVIIISLFFFYRNGSIKVDMSLIFKNSSMVPSSVEVESILNKNAMNGSIPLNIILDTIKAGECVQVQYTNQHNGETFQIKFNVLCTFYFTGEIVTSNTPAPDTNVTIQTTTMRSTASTNGIECYVSSILFNTFKYIIIYYFLYFLSFQRTQTPPLVPFLRWHAVH